MHQTETRLLKENLKKELNAVGKFICSKRQAAGLSQAELARVSGVGAHMNIARYENGSARIPLENIKPIASALKCDLIEFTRLVLPLYGLRYLKKYLPKKTP